MVIGTSFYECVRERWDCLKRPVSVRCNIDAIVAVLLHAKQVVLTTHLPTCVHLLVVFGLARARRLGVVLRLLYHQ